MSDRQRHMGNSWILRMMRGELASGALGTMPHTRFMSIPCSCCKEDTTHYVGKCIHCKTINVVIPDIKPKKFLIGRGVA